MAAVLSLLAVANTMSSVAGSSSSEPAGMWLNGSLDAHPGSPPQLRRLADVPGHKPDRVNDLLLLRPLEGLAACSADAEAYEDGNSHVVFFHGDIQVSYYTRTVQSLGSVLKLSSNTMSQACYFGLKVAKTR